MSYPSPAVGVLTPTALAFALALAVPAQDSRESQPAHADWSSDLDATLANATAAKRPALVFFTASWCQPCQQLKRAVLEKPEFAQAFAGHAFVMVDIDSATGKVARSEWEVGPIPDLRFVASSGVETGGFVGERSLAAILQVQAEARASEGREQELRMALSGKPGDPFALLALGEHLLLRPTKRPALRVLEEAVTADADDRAGVAERAHWLIVGARFHPIARQGQELVADAQARLSKLEACAAAGTQTALPYAEAIRAWLAWNAEMQAWGEQRKAGGGKDLALEVAATAPLRLVLAKLEARLAAAPKNDVAADGLLIDGLMHYYGRDYRGGIERLERFTKGFPKHRWHSEGERFLGICRRLATK